jgi:hypothetical protein
MRQVKVKLGRTYNMGNYESLRVEVEVATEVPYPTSYQHACKDAFVEARKALKTEAHKLIKAIRDQ